MDKKKFEKQSLLYQENAKIAAIFWEWRHKILTYFFTAIGALFAIAGWLYQQNFGRYVSAPLFIGFILSIVSYFSDQRNADILKKCYKVGADIESELRANGNGIFSYIEDAHKSGADGEVTFIKILKALCSFMTLNTICKDVKLTYTETLRATYFGIGILLLTLSIYNLASPIKGQHNKSMDASAEQRPSYKLVCEPVACP